MPKTFTTFLKAALVSFILFVCFELWLSEHKSTGQSDMNVKYFTGEIVHVHRFKSSQSTEEQLTISFAMPGHYRVEVETYDSPLQKTIQAYDLTIAQEQVGEPINLKIKRILHWMKLTVASNGATEEQKFATE